MLARWGSRLPGGVRVFTSNVDGQFQRAGFPDEHTAEVHGSIHHLQCATPCHGEIWPASEIRIEVDPESMRASERLPSCPRCGGLARPNILMFGDYAWVPDHSGRRLEALTA